MALAMVAFIAHSPSRASEIASKEASLKFLGRVVNICYALILLKHQEWKYYTHDFGWLCVSILQCIVLYLEDANYILPPLHLNYFNWILLIKLRKIVTTN